MSIWFWLRRFFTVLALAFLVIASSHVLRGRPIKYAVTEGLVWGLIASALFLGTRLYWSRKGERCGLCADVPKNEE